MSATATADLYDERREAVQTTPLQFISVGGHVRFDGPIRTVACFEDNALLKATLGTPGGGAVLVVDGGGSLGTALVGDIIGGLAVENGWAGIVVHGAIRDRVALGGLSIGILALGTNPRGGAKSGEGELDATLEFGDVVFRPGAHLWADEDGILVER
ncbi:ribonuclease E activity regulator RraA [Agromyces seonyuensis]|uniref:4-hydroxy-4-methyl-2-oxoglutarate aldolase n=1 Tax=Agromyces seonyuensis TaxID=2662446 RepID=A0A6I4P3G0_9MICO|nr:ribonuclease E activity regulator RraA [Agromyces seonyuensis]MWB97867.1 ribonuclease E activity regulator RraA [Agromyces seonyuensis]